MKLVWQILLGVLIPAYLVGAGALTHFGYNQYFSIPSTYVDISAVFYSLFALNVYTIVVEVFRVSSWWGLLIFGVLLGALVVGLYKLKIVGKLIAALLIILMLIKLLFGMVQFGEGIAKTQTRYLTPVLPCATLASTTERYIVPVLTGDTAIIVTIDEDKKLQPGFMVRNIKDLGCVLRFEEIGQVKH